MTNYCECGCEKEIAEGKKYILGHNLRNPQKRKLVEEKRVRALRMNPVIHNGTNTGKKFTEEHKEKIRVSNIGVTRSEETVQRNREARLRNWQNPEYRERMIKAHKANPNRYWSGKKRSAQTIELIRQKAKERMANPEYALMIAHAAGMKPNKHEIYIIALLETNFPKQWIYVGNYKKWIGGHNPDFVHVERPLIIEYDGFWMHKYRREQDEERNRRYIEQGYKVLVLLEEDKKNPAHLISKVKAFLTES